jgi:uncharacterized protein (DUF1697 family)
VQYAVFLRAINVGKTNRITSAALQALLLESGCSDVQTYLQTGNILLSSQATPQALAQTLEQVFVDRGFKDVAVMVRTRAEMDLICAAQPFDGSRDGFEEYLTLLRHPSDKTLPTPPADLEILEQTGLAVYSRLEKKPKGTALGTWCERHLKVKTTSRYWRVVQEVYRRMD